MLSDVAINLVLSLSFLLSLLSLARLSSILSFVRLVMLGSPRSFGFLVWPADRRLSLSLASFCFSYRIAIFIEIEIESKLNQNEASASLLSLELLLAYSSSLPSVVYLPSLLEPLRSINLPLFFGF